MDQWRTHSVGNSFGLVDCPVISQNTGEDTRMSVCEIFSISDTTCEDFSLLRAKYSIWTHTSTHFLPLSLFLISSAHLVSLKGTIPFGNVGGFFSLSSSLVVCKICLTALVSKSWRASLHRIMSCGAQRRQTSSQLNHSTSNPSITHHLLG